MAMLDGQIVTLQGVVGEEVESWTKQVQLSELDDPQDSRTENISKILKQVLEKALEKEVLQGVLELRGFEQRSFEQCGFLERFKEF